MKVAIFVPNCNPGGTERVASRLAGLFGQRGIEVRMITLCQGAFPYPVPDEVFSLDDGVARSKVQALWFRYRRLRDVVCQEKFSHIISMGEYPNLLNAFLPEAITRIGRVTNSFSSMGGVRFFPIKMLTQWLYPRLDCIVTPSEGLRKELAGLFGIRTRVRSIYNLVDVPEPASAESPPDDGRFRLLHIAQLVEQKNQRTLLKVFRKIRERLPDSTLTIIGKGPEEENLRTLTGRLGLTDDVRFLGWQSDPFQFMRQSHVFLLTSLWEGMPNVLVESMACGCPVVSFDCPTGPSEIIDRPGENGSLVPLGDVDYMVETTVAILSDPERRRALSIGARRRARDFSLESIGSDYLALLKE